MLIVMRAQATEEQIRAVCERVESLGYRAHPMPGAQRTAIGITGNKGEVEAGTLEEMPGVQELIRVSKPYKLVSRDVKPDNSVIRFPGFASDHRRYLILSLWPVHVASRAATRPSRSPITWPAPAPSFFRGGAYKPRTFSLFLSGTWRRRSEDHGRDPATASAG